MPVGFWLPLIPGYDDLLFRHKAELYCVLKEFEKYRDTKAVVLVGEIGGCVEEEAARFYH